MARDAKYNALKTMIDAGAAGVAWTQDDETIAAALNAATETEVYSRLITGRTIFAEIDAATATSLLGKFKAAAQSDDVLGLAWAAVNSYTAGGGLDAGSAATRQLLDGYVQAGVFAQAEADAVKALAERTVPLLRSIGWSKVTDKDIAHTRTL